MNPWRVFVQSVFLAGIFPLGLPAQVTPQATDTAISELATRIGERLKESRARNVVVADLTGPQGLAHPLGKWFADQISRDLATDFPALKVLDRPQLQPFSSEDAGATGPGTTGIVQAQSAARDWARRLGARVVVTGVFADQGKGVGVSLKAFNSSPPGLVLTQEWGFVPDHAISATSHEPLPSISPIVPTAGRNGFGFPECIYCPPPNYTDEARRLKMVGSVVLQVTVTAEGTLADFYIWRSLGGGLDEQAIKVLRTWKFKPATGPDGSPATVTTPIEVTFRLY